MEIRTLDLGHGGIGAISERAIPVGTEGKLTVAFYFNGASRMISANCKIAHCIYGSGGFKIGLSFAPLSPESISVVAEYLRT